MQKFRLVAGCAIAAAVAVLPALTAHAEPPATGGPPAATQPARPSARLRGAYAIMASELQLTDEQRAQLEQHAAAKEAALQAWKQEHQAELEQIKQERERVQASGDREAAASLRARFSALNAERKALEDRYDSQIQAMLTPEQQRRWEGVNLFQGAMQRYRRLELTEEQRAQIRQRCLEAGATLERDEDGRPRGNLKATLWEGIEKDVLTAEQREHLNSPREPRNPAGGPAEQPKEEQAQPVG